LDETNVTQGVTGNYKNRTNVWSVDFVESVKMLEKMNKETSIKLFETKP
jgi:hypothetical protein